MVPVLGHQIDEDTILCLACLPARGYQEQRQGWEDAGKQPGPVLEHNVDLHFGDEDLCCTGCGAAIVTAPTG